MTSFLVLAVSVFIEAESFSDLGGWSLDTQHMETMGSPYLIAHGLGTPVDDAATDFTLETEGDYQVWVRTRNWTAPWSGVPAGRFRVAVDDCPLETVFGEGAAEWSWVRASTAVRLGKGRHRLAFRDLTGFDARVDAVCLTTGDRPPDRRQIGQPLALESRQFDLVVCGGGVAGICAAVSAARQGLQVALVQDRPVLGGNNSSEIRVWLGGHIHVGRYPKLGDVVAEIGPSGGGNARSAGFFEDDRKLRVVRAESNISLFLNVKAMSVEKKGDAIAAVIGRDMRSGGGLRFVAPLFVDATGDGSIGFLAGADFRTGREARAETGERRAPETADRLVMGASCQWRAVETGTRQEFPWKDWMVPLTDATATAALRGDWDWETGLDRDQIAEAERIRDYGMLMAYSNWAFVKNRSAKKDDFTTKRLDWVAYVAGKRESRRLLGDVVLTWEDIMNFRRFPDGTCCTSWSVDLHYPKTAAETGFAGESFRSKCVQDKIVIYPIPYRCLYSRNIGNLFMAGRDISVTHAALGTVRVMRTTGMMGEVVGLAAAVCRAHDCRPRDVYADHFAELEAKMAKGAGAGLRQDRQTYNLHPTLGTDPDDPEKRTLHGMLNWHQTKIYWNDREFGPDGNPTWDCTPLFEGGFLSAGEDTIGSLHCLSTNRPSLYVGRTTEELRTRMDRREQVELVRGERPDEWKTPAAKLFRYFHFEGDIKDAWYRVGR